MPDSLLVLTVDHNPNNRDLLDQSLQREGYRTLGVTRLDELDQAIAGGERIDAALVDVTGFDQSIWTHCAALQAKGVPFAIIFPKQGTSLQNQALAHGARGVLLKPMAIKDLLELVRVLPDPEK